MSAKLFVLVLIGFNSITTVPGFSERGCAEAVQKTLNETNRLHAFCVETK